MRILRIRDVVQQTGISRTSIWRLERVGQFPQRIDLLGGRVGWYDHEVQKWIRLRRTPQTQRGDVLEWTEDNNIELCSENDEY